LKSNILVGAAALILLASSVAHAQSPPVSEVVEIEIIDPGATYRDADGDGYNEMEDCDDTTALRNPGMPEIIGDAIDNNCNGVTDEGAPTEGTGGNEQQVPEPSIIALFGLGLVGLGFARRRRQS
jgi:hypothetical protein